MMMRDSLDRLFRRRGVRVVREPSLGLVAGDVYLSRLTREFAFDFVFDIGANAGQYAWKLRTDVGYTGHILSVEPIPELISQLRAAFANDPDWSHMACALDRAEGTTEFNVMEGSQFSSILTATAEFEGSFKGKTRISKRIQVPVRRFDAVFREMQQEHGFSNPFLKLDTQGTELRILEGATDVLPQIPAIQMEISFATIYDDAPDFYQMFQFMADSGYELSGLFPNNYGHFPRLLEMDAVFVRRELMPANADLK
jgi:FkbM family methyltransferase